MTTMNINTGIGNSPWFRGGNETAVKAVGYGGKVSVGRTATVPNYYAAPDL